MHLFSNFKVYVLNRGHFVGDCVVLHLHDGQEGHPLHAFGKGVMAEQSNCAQHESPSLTDVLNLLVMALFLGLRLCAVEEHRMWLTLFLVIYILL